MDFSIHATAEDFREDYNTQLFETSLQLRGMPLELLEAHQQYPQDFTLNLNPSLFGKRTP